MFLNSTDVGPRESAADVGLRALTDLLLQLTGGRSAAITPLQVTAEIGGVVGVELGVLEPGILVRCVVLESGDAYILTLVIGQQVPIQPRDYELFEAVCASVRFHGG